MRKKNRENQDQFEKNMGHMWEAIETHLCTAEITKSIKNLVQNKSLEDDEFEKEISKINYKKWIASIKIFTFKELMIVWNIFSFITDPNKKITIMSLNNFPSKSKQFLYLMK